MLVRSMSPGRVCLICSMGKFLHRPVDRVQVQVGPHRVRQQVVLPLLEGRPPLHRRLPQSQPPAGMAPGEVYLFGPGKSSIYLRSDGTIRLQGDVEIQGSLAVNGEPYKPCRC